MEGARHTWTLRTAYYPGLSERIGKVVHSARIGVTYKPQHTFHNVISKLKDTISSGDEIGVVVKLGVLSAGIIVGGR